MSGPRLFGHLFRRLPSWSVAVIPAILVASLGACMTAGEHPDGSNVADLASVGSFSSIADPNARSAALFTEMARVIQHPRCLNCHPVTRSPTQGDDLHPHVPPISSDSDIAAAGMPCSTCHQTHNSLTSSPGIRSVPGAEHWGLAPESMAWQGLTTAEVCEQIKDPARNGNRSLEKIRVHLAEDHLVGWGWHPGEGRAPVPGTQEQFGELVTAWIETGAHCPK
jgi:hypothetical protein